MNALLEALRRACPCGNHPTPQTRPRCQTCGHDHATKLNGQPCLRCEREQPQSGRQA